MLPHGTHCLRNSVASLYEKSILRINFFYVLRDPPKHVKNLKKQGFSLPFWPKWRSRARPRAVAKNHDFSRLFVSSTCMIKKDLSYTACVTLHYITLHFFYHTVRILELQKAQNPASSGDPQNRPLGQALHCAPKIALRCTVLWIAITSDMHTYT